MKTCLAAFSGPPWPPPGIEFLTSTRITAVDVAAKTAQLEEGGSITWGKLVIATGARAVSLADFGSPGATLPGIHTLRNLADADALLADLAATREAGGKVGASPCALQPVTKCLSNPSQLPLLFHLHACLAAVRCQQQDG